MHCFYSVRRGYGLQYSNLRRFKLVEEGSWLQEDPIIVLRKLENEFINFYRQKQYAVAAKKAQEALEVANELIDPRHSYHAVLESNLRYARQALLKYGPVGRPMPRVYPSKGSYGQSDSGAGRSRARTRRSGDCNLTGKTKQQQKRGGGWLAGGLLAAFILSTGFLWGWPVFKKGGMDRAIYPAATTEYATESDLNELADTVFEQDLQKIKDALNNRSLLQPEMRLKVPLILQNPELPRGCEVTCLAMLLQYAGVAVDKMTLAEEIKKDPAIYQIKKGEVYFGNPYYGYVGNMYTLREPGYGVYHGPVQELLERYLPGRTIDLTRCAFEEILFFISEGVPVWVLTNATFAPLAAREFQIWHTLQGLVEITYREHAVLLTGYDEKYVYFNDPLSAKKNKRVDRSKFIAAWEQMGCQAVTYLPD